MSDQGYDIYKRNIGGAVKSLRRSRGIKQQDLARQLSITANYLSLLESGKRGISVSQLKELAAALGVPTTYITAMAEPSSGDKAADRLMRQIQGLIKVAIEADTVLKGQARSPGRLNGKVAPPKKSSKKLPLEHAD